MKKFNKQLLIPILTLIALVVKQMFHIDIPDAAIDLGADIIMGIVALAGFFIHPQVSDPVQTGGQQNGSTEHTSDPGPSV